MTPRKTRAGTQIRNGISPSRPGLLKQLNAGQLLNLLRSHNPCSRADLVRMSGLSAPTVSSTVAYLQRKGLIKELGLGTSNGGRRPDMLCFNPNCRLRRRSRSGWNQHSARDCRFRREDSCALERQYARKPDAGQNRKLHSTPDCITCSSRLEFPRRDCLLRAWERPALRMCALAR